MKYVPSPIPLRYNYIYSAAANKSGRMQYYKVTPNKSRERISRTEFIDVFNKANILAIRPVPLPDTAVIQMEFYI